jgi:hypothetical protein
VGKIALIELPSFGSYLKITGEPLTAQEPKLEPKNPEQSLLPFSWVSLLMLTSMRPAWAFAPNASANASAVDRTHIDLSMVLP